MKLPFVLILFFIVNLTNIFSQNKPSVENLLLIRKTNSSKRAYYGKGSPIIIQSKDSIQYAEIKRIELDSMLLDTTWVNYANIESIIDPTGRHFLKTGTVMFPIAGIAFFFITTLNAIINNDQPIFYREHLIPSAGLIGLGAIMWPFKTQKYRLKRNWELIVMPS